MLSMAKINDIKYLKQVQGLSYRKVKILTGHSQGLIKYLCKPSSWGNIKLSNLEVFL
ncbi:MAG: hypothetical protein RR191_06895 [Cetobacterium sp.]